MSSNGHIVAIGGGGFGRNPNKPIIEDYIVNLSPAKKPKIAFFPTASAENIQYIVNFYTAFTQLNCSPKDISLFKKTPDLESVIDEADIIYVGGGNTKSMLAVFSDWGLDKLLIDAYKQGKVLAGVSAGAICWFEKGITDSWASELKVLDCLGILEGVCCPHYDGEADRRPSVENFLKKNQINESLCIEDGSAVHYHGDTVKTAISFYKDKNAYNVKYENSLIETPLKKIQI
ncbi:MAG: peptidase E [bacterium TMED6]|nr:MAG: peptidase E [bacterium TMED6]